MLGFEGLDEGWWVTGYERFVMYAKDWATECESEAIDVTFQPVSTARVSAPKRSVILSDLPNSDAI